MVLQEKPGGQARRGEQALWSTRLRRAGRSPGGLSAAKSEVAKAGAAEIEGQTRLGPGLLITEHDFVRLAPGRSITRTLTVWPECLEALREPGRVTIRGVYHYRRPEAPLIGPPQNAWEGSVASDPVEIELLRQLER